MITQYLECSLGGKDSSFTVELLTSLAPKSCHFLLNHLPIKTETFNSKWNGAELFVVLPPMEILPNENTLDTPQVGDVVFFHRSPTYRAAPKTLRAENLGAYVELGFYYDSLIRSYGPDGPSKGTRLGRIVEGLENLAETTSTMRRQGFLPLSIKLRS